MSYHTRPSHIQSIVVWQPSEPFSDHPFSPSPPPPPPSTRSGTLLDFRIFFKLKRQFNGWLHDGGTSTFLGSSGATSRQAISCIFNLRCFLSKSGASYVTLWDMLSSLGVLDGEAVNESIAIIFSKGRIAIADKWETNKGRRVIPLRVEIKVMAMQDVWVHYDGRYLTNRAMRESMEELEATNYGMVPARKSSMKRLLETGEVLMAGDDDERGNQESKRKRRRLGCESCSICLEEFEVGSSAAFMPCSHVFHKDCIFKWLEQSHYCPICRFEMPTN